MWTQRKRGGRVLAFSFHQCSFQSSGMMVPQVILLGVCSIHFQHSLNAHGSSIPVDKSPELGPLGGPLGCWG